ncbi:MAG: hypothetical protein H6740_10825 [Alphaproteobacteria bacterium]|nr:hypothetical protein [Alphaproteobacteria bacterium]
MLVLLLGMACSGPDGDDAETWLIQPRMDSTPYAGGEGYSFDSPQAAFFAAGHVAPTVDSRWSFPATQIPLLIWEEVLLGENVADSGSCPYLTADGAETTWRTNCRSQDGFNWSGSVVKVEWEEDGNDWLHYQFDLLVETELENQPVNRVSLVGEFYYADGDNAPLVRHAESNLRMEVDGYWARGFEDELEMAWSQVDLSGTWETREDEDGRWTRFETEADLGDYGGFTASSDALFEPNDCVAEPEGSVFLGGDVEAELRFEGPSRCDGCAELYLDGERSTNACRGW